MDESEVLLSSGVTPEIRGIVDSTSAERREHPDTHEQVLQAFRDGLSLLEDGERDHSLNAVESWVLRTVKDAYAKTDIEHGRDSYINTVTSPGESSFRIQERIPVEGVIAFLDKKLREAEAAGDNDTALKHRETLATLAKNSRLYRRPGRSLTPEQFLGKVSQEAYFISSPDPSTYIDPRDRHDPRENWLLAEQMINGRIELFLPEAEPVIPSEPDPDHPTDVIPPPEKPEPAPVHEPGGGDGGSGGGGREEDDVDEDDATRKEREIREFEERKNHPYVVQIANNEAEVRKYTEQRTQEEMQKIDKQRYEGVTLPKNVILRAGRLLAHQVAHPKIIFSGIRREYVKNVWRHEKLKSLADANLGASSTTTAEDAREINELRAKGRLAQQGALELDEAGVKVAGYDAEVKVAGYDAFELKGEFKKDIMEGMLIPAREALKSGGNPQDIEADLQRKLYEYVQNHQGDDEISQKVREFLGKNSSRYGELSKFYASNLFETAQKLVEDEVTREMALEVLDEIIKIKLTKAQEGASTEVSYTVFERLMKASQQRRTLCWVTPAMAGAAVAIGLTAYRYGSKSAVRKGALVGASLLISPWAAPIAGVAVGAVYAYKREKGRLKEEIGTVGRGVEAGKITHNPDNPKNARRAELEGFVRNMSVRYDQLLYGDTRPDDVGETITGGARRREAVDKILSSRLDLSGVSSADEVREISQNREQLKSRYAEIVARLNASENSKRELRKMFLPSLQEVGRIQYKNGEIDALRLELLQAMIKLRNKSLEVGITPDELKLEVDRWSTFLLENREEQEKAFRRLSTRRALQKAVFAGTLGGALGFVDQEAMALAFRHIPGLADTGFAQSMKGETEIERALHHIGIGHETHQPSVTLESLGRAYQNGGNMNISQNIQAHIDPSTHQVTLFENGHALSENMKMVVNSNGTLHVEGNPPPDLRQALQADGIKIEQGTPVLHQNPDTTILQNTGKTYDAAIGTGYTHETALDHGALTSIPEGTQWINGPNGAHELIVTGHPGHPLAIADAQNHLTTTDFGKQYLEISTTTRGGGTVTLEKPVMGPNGLWQQNATEINGREWYANNTSVPDLNELGFYTYKDGHDIIFSIDGMKYLSFQRGLIPPNISPREFFADPAKYGGSPGLFFSRPDDPLHGIRLIPKFDPVTGQVDVRLTPDSPLYKMLINAPEFDKLPNGNIATELFNHENVYNLAVNGKPGFIEYGRFAPNGTLQDFATIHGTNPVPETILTSAPAPSHDIPSISLQTPIHIPTPPTEVPVYNLIPPHEVLAPPMIPLPFDVRSPLFPIESIIIYGYGAHSEGTMGWIPREKYPSRRSKTLNDDPNAKLDEHTEIADYLSRVDSTYRAELETMDNDIHEPMLPQTRAVVTIPTFGEGKIIYKTLEQFLNQKDRDGNPLDPKLFEIIIFENDTADRPRDETQAEIERFKRDHPEFNIHYAYKRWEQEDIDKKVNTVGNGRRYNCDLALLRSSKRASQDGELIIINNDADLEGISEHYITDVINEFDHNENLDFVVGKRNLPESVLQKPNIRAGQRLWEIFDAVMRHTGGQKVDEPGTGMEPSERKRGWPGMIGENSAMKASIYAAVGGYLSTANLAEDQILGDMMRVARNYHDERFEYVNRLRTIKNPRRYLACMVAGIPLVQMYDDYHENKKIREMNNSALLNNIPDIFNLNRFELDADGIYQTRNEYPDMGESNFEERFRKAMAFMGAEYKIVDGHVKITNADRLISTLNRSSTHPPKDRFSIIKKRLRRTT